MVVLPIVGYIVYTDDDSANPEGFRILVANLDGPDENYGLTGSILLQLRRKASLFDSVKVVPLDSTITAQEGRDEARRVGIKKEADLVLWGWYRTFSAAFDSASSVVQVEIIGESSIPGIPAPRETYYPLYSPRSFKAHYTTKKNGPDFRE